MPSFGEKSLEHLATCHPDLQRLFKEVVQRIDCVILCGHRDKADQDAAVASGHSKTPWPHSRHNSTPSEAADVAPYPVDWDDLQRFKDFAYVVKWAADDLGIAIEWGGDFVTLKDFDHWQLPHRGCT